MKHTSMMFLLFLILHLSTVSDAFAQGQTRSKTKKATSASCCVKPPEEATAISDASLYQTESHWTTQDHEVIRLKKFQGKIVITTMIFTTCTYACPQIIADLKAIESALTPMARDSVTFVLITMDVERDTPEVLGAFAKTMMIDKHNWVFLHGSADDTREFAALVGINYKKMSDGSYSHSNIITVLNAKGEIAYQQTGLNADHKPTAAKVQGLLEQE